ncbi:MAG: NUDIX domain-containing protein [Moraxella sp.]|nr:NUDIX domain-containing protein [Moraxella sp.]
MTNGSFMHKKIIDVAIGVLRFGDEFLLARRLAHQHQGDKFEFIGGKVQSTETPRQALVREVAEELGLDIHHDTLVKMGRICHDYDDRAVCLHVFECVLDDEQYQAFKACTHGKQGQGLHWYIQADLLRLQHEFPKANAPIFAWLMLPKQVVISGALSEFDGGQVDSVQAWCEFYAKRLPMGATLYARLQCDDELACQAILSLAAQRSDIRWIVPIRYYQDFAQIMQGVPVLAVHLTQDALLMYAKTAQPNIASVLQALPIIASTHDEFSVQTLNQLSKQAKVLGAFISPVKPTQTHPNATTLGWENFDRLANLCDVPVLALGGMNADDLPIAQKHGAWGVSGIRGFV